MHATLVARLFSIAAPTVWNSFPMHICDIESLGTFKRPVKTYRKIPKISPGAYIFERPFLRGLFLEGLIFGGAYLRREICVSKLIGLAL